MPGEWIRLAQTGEPGMEAYRVAGSGAAPGGIALDAEALPVIVLLQEIFGVNSFVKDTAEVLAHNAFEVLAPDLFWRQRPRISLDYSPAGRAESGTLMAQFDTGQGLADLEELIAALRRRRPLAKIAAIGFCLGGKLAAILGARGEVDLGVSFYGVELDAYIDELGAARSPLLLHFGERDAQIPLELVGRIERSSAANNAVEVHVHPGAAHGFYNRLRPDRFHEEAAGKAMTRTLELLTRIA